MPTLLAALSALSWGVSDFIGGVTTRRSPALVVVLWSQLVGLVMVAVAAPLIGSGEADASVVVWGLLAGAAGAGGLVALYHGLATGSMAVVAPLSAVVGSAVPIMIGVAAGERPDSPAWLGILAAIPAIWLVSRSTGPRGGEGALTGLAAGLGFGLFFVFLSFTSSDAGLWPLVPARLGSVALVATIGRVRRRPLRPTPGTGLPIAAAGAGDMLANILFLLAVHRGLLSLTAVVASLYPAFTVLLARTVLGETIGALRWVGIALALAAVALIAS